MTVDRTDGQSEGFVDGSRNGNGLSHRRMEGVDAYNVSSQFVDAMPGNVNVGSGDHIVLVDDTIGEEDTGCVDIEDDDTEGKRSDETDSAGVTEGKVHFLAFHI